MSSQFLRNTFARPLKGLDNLALGQYLVTRPYVYGNPGALDEVKLRSIDTPLKPVKFDTTFAPKIKPKDNFAEGLSKEAKMNKAANNTVSVIGANDALKFGNYAAAEYILGRPLTDENIKQQTINGVDRKLIKPIGRNVEYGPNGLITNIRPTVYKGTQAIPDVYLQEILGNENRKNQEKIRLEEEKKEIQERREQRAIEVIDGVFTQYPIGKIEKYSKDYPKIKNILGAVEQQTEQYYTAIENGVPKITADKIVDQLQNNLDLLEKLVDEMEEEEKEEKKQREERRQLGIEEPIEASEIVEEEIPEHKYQILRPSRIESLINKGNTSSSTEVAGIVNDGATRPSITAFSFYRPQQNFDYLTNNDLVGQLYNDRIAQNFLENSGVIPPPGTRERAYYDYEQLNKRPIPKGKGIKKRKFGLKKIF